MFQEVKKISDKQFECRHSDYGTIIVVAKNEEEAKLRALNFWKLSYS